MKKKGRSAQVVISGESKVLRQLRIKHQLSMKAAGDKLGYSGVFGLFLNALQKGAFNAAIDIFDRSTSIIERLITETANAPV